VLAQRHLVEAGARIRVWSSAHPGGWVVGVLGSLNEDSLVLTRPWSAPVSMSTASVSQLQVSLGERSKAGKGAAIGAGIGAAVGVLLGALVASSAEVAGHPVLIVGGGLVGVAVGAGFGAITSAEPKEVWHEIPRPWPTVGAGGAPSTNRGG
jgi:hypothetical protein